MRVTDERRGAADMADVGDLIQMKELADERGDCASDSNRSPHCSLVIGQAVRSIVVSAGDALEGRGEELFQ